ncbi:unnamed protein product [Penicillium salamii]|nr:unnamed protein product [Penicillium salamii]CAG8254117.1 unnamed protein product [Penicillium salamii]
MMLFHTIKSLAIGLALGTSVLASHSSHSLVSRRLTEYQMPVATQTHEVAHVPNSNFVLLTQMSNSELIKIELDSTTEEPIAFHSFPMGKNSTTSMLHGVWPSTIYPGMMWLSLQGENKLLLVDPGKKLSTPPIIKKTINIPAPGNGPHCVFEIGNRVWAGLKVASEQTGKYYSRVHQGGTTTGLIYVTQDNDSSIMRINATSGETKQMHIPPSVGNTAVGMISATGPLGGVWFTLAGNATGGTGTFGHIGASGKMQFFKLKHPLLGTNAGLLHIADASTAAGPALWLLSTSLLSTESPNALIRVTFDDAMKSIADEEYISMLTQNAMVHRILPLNHTVLVSELHTFTLAQLSYKNTVAGKWLPAQAVTNTSVYTEAS